MEDHKDHKKDFDEAYNMASAGWSKYTTEAGIDLRSVAGDQWNATWKAFLKSAGRSQTVFNHTKRVVKIVSGYQRKNRLALKIVGEGFEDSAVGDQMNGVMMKVMASGPGSGRGYSVMSDAFEFGALCTGANLVEPYIDFKGNIRFKRLAYNKFLFDPLFTERDLNDCRFIIRGEAISKEDAQLLMPDKVAEIESLGKGNVSRKFSQAAFSQNAAAKDMLTYEEFWQQTTREQITLINRKSRQEIPYEGTKEDLVASLQQDYQMSGYERFAVTTAKKKTVELQVYLQDVMFYRGPDPYGLDEYRFVPVMGHFTPELADDALKLQGLVRCIRGPQEEYNKRMSQQVDMIESQINSGYDVIEGSVVEEESLYKSGQGKVNYIKSVENGNPHGLDAVRRKEPAQIPPSFFQLSDQIAKEIDLIPGMNEELFGTETKQIPGVLSKLRSGAALTILQDLFDYYRDAKSLLGHKIIKLVQKNFSPEKIQKMLGPEKQIDPAFYTEDIDQNDVAVTEGMLTDSQREMYYQEIKLLRSELGIQIPDSAIIDAAPMQFKDRLVEQIAAAEEGQAQQQQYQEEIQKLTNQLLMSQISENQAQAGERETQTQQNITSSELNQAKTLTELARLNNTPVSLLKDIQSGNPRVVAKPIKPQKKTKKKLQKAGA